MSTTQISLSARISARGGGGTGAGAGGAIHLIAPNVTGSGQLFVQGGFHPLQGTIGGAGWIRFNTTTNTFTGGTDSVSLNNGLYVGPLYNVPPNNILAFPSLIITKIDSVPVPSPPLGGYLTPDVQINASNAVNVEIAAVNIPINTVVKLRLQTETSGDILIDCNPLAGASAAATTATCVVDPFPFSISITSARATW